LTLIPPVDAYAERSCNWYCHRLFSAGRQHGPCEARQATGAGGAATAAAKGQSARARTTRGIDGPGLVIILHLHFQGVRIRGSRPRSREADLFHDPFTTGLRAQGCGTRKGHGLSEPPPARREVVRPARFERATYRFVESNK